MSGNSTQQTSAKVFKSVESTFGLVSFFALRHWATWVVRFVSPMQKEQRRKFLRTRWWWWGGSGPARSQLTPVRRETGDVW